MTIIFSGTIGQSGLGGQAWASLQYLLGLRALGHEVFYLEDCGESSWAYNWEKVDVAHEISYPAHYVHACLEPFGFGDKWIYRTSDESAGIPLPNFLKICSRADLLIMRAVPFWIWRKEYEKPRRRIFIDVDPGFTQRNISNGDKGLADGIARCEKRFTIGQKIGSPECSISTVGGPWLPTSPLISLEHWPYVESDAMHFTSIIRWQGITVFNEQQENSDYGQRDQEFPKFLDLPKLTAQKFRIAMIGTEEKTLTDHGWEVASGEIISKTPMSYQKFIQNSRAELGVPKQGYVATRGGWFSDRSVCYLASGRPVLFGETGLSDWIPTGEGLLTFRDLPEATAGVKEINSNYEKHRRAARRLAEKYFATGKVLPPLLEAAMN